MVSRHPSLGSLWLPFRATQLKIALDETALNCSEPTAVERHPDTQFSIGQTLQPSGSQLPSMDPFVARNSSPFRHIQLLLAHCNCHRWLIRDPHG